MASRAIADLPSNSALRYILESSDCFYTGKFSRCNKLLCLAYEKLTRGSTTEMFFVEEYMVALKHLGEDVGQDM